jgi:hypothetical protein
MRRWPLKSATLTPSFATGAEKAIWLSPVSFGLCLVLVLVVF